MYIAVLFLVIRSAASFDTDLSYAGGSRNGILHTIFLHFVHASQPWIHASTRHYLLCAVRWIHYLPCGPFIHLEELELILKWDIDGWQLLFLSPKLTMYRTMIMSVVISTFGTLPLAV
jgi:hypothetical protein